MNILLSTLPYDLTALEPAMSADTLVFHLSQHRRDGFDRTTALIRGTELDSLPLEELVRVTARTPGRRTVYQCAAETWNHNFFWKSMRPGGGGAAYGLIGERIGAHFGGYEEFVREFKSSAAGLFGNGWLWVTLKDGAIQIVTTANADTPIVYGQTPLLALDLWEHAYYLDHQNRRSAYVTAFLEELVDWDCANRILQERMVVPVPDALAGTRLKAMNAAVDSTRRASGSGAERASRGVESAAHPG
jgi:superoxide dismutase, Fe-Mn family